MKTLIQAPVEKPAIALSANTWACVVAGFTSRGSQKASSTTALRRETTEMELKRPKRSARYAGRIRPMIELPLEKESGIFMKREKGRGDYFSTTIVYIAVSLEKLCRRAIVGRKFQVEKSPQLF
jgi:hypothetical protein